MAKAGLDYAPPETYAKVVPERATRIAAAYDQMKHDPQNPEVRRAYRAMIDETKAQYDAMLADGMKISFIPHDAPDPYKGNPRNMTEDVRNNKHMWVFSTKDGFGSDATFDPKDNPLLEDSGYTISGQPATMNDIFRAVHDYFGHVKEGVGFRADGEENAWRSHSAMYSPEARKAMTSETRGQNSWVNYGPYGETNRTAKSGQTHYADQKIGLLPDWAVHEGAGDASVANTMAERFAAAGRPEEEAKANGALVDAFYSTMGASEDQFPLPEVRRGDVAPDGALNQLAANPANEFAKKTNALVNAKSWPGSLDSVVKLVKKVAPEWGYSLEAITKGISDEPDHFAAAIKMLDDRGWTQGDIATAGGVAKAVVQEIEFAGDSQHFKDADTNPANKFVDHAYNIDKASWWPNAIDPLVKLVKKITPGYGYDAGAIKDAIEGDTSIASAALAALDKMGWTPADIDKHGGLVKTVQSEIENVGKQGWLKSPQSKIAEDSLPKPDANPLDEFVNTPDEQFTSSAHAPLKKLLLEHKAKIGHLDNFSDELHHSGLWEPLLSHAKQYGYDDIGKAVATNVENYVKKALGAGTETPALKEYVNPHGTSFKKLISTPISGEYPKAQEFQQVVKAAVAKGAQHDTFASVIDSDPELLAAAKKAVDGKYHNFGSSPGEQLSGWFDKLAPHVFAEDKPKADVLAGLDNAVKKPTLSDEDFNKSIDHVASVIAEGHPIKQFADYGQTYPDGSKGYKLAAILNKALEHDPNPDHVAMMIDNNSLLYGAAKKLMNEYYVSDGAATAIDEAGGVGNLVVDKAKDALAYAKETPAGQKFFGDYSASKTPAKQAPPPEGPKLPPKDLTQTTAFKNWFGDSAVVDDNGKPQVVYHGTRNGGFRQFKEGSFFAADPKTSRTYSGSNDKPIELTHPEDLLNHPERAAKELHDPTLKIVRHPPVGAKGEDWYTITYREPYSHDRIVDHYSSRFDALHAIDHLAESADQRHGTKTTGLYPVYLKMEHPFEVDWEGNDWSTGPYINGASNEPVTRYDVYLDGDHYDTYDNYDDAQQKVDEHLDELRSNAESEMRDRLQDKFQIVAPTPLFGDKNYVVYQLDDDGERITDSVYDGPQEFEDLAGVQAYIEDTINNKAEDAGTEAIDNSESHVSETDDYEDNGGHEGLSTDKVVSMVRNGDLGDGSHDGVIFRDIKDTLNGTGAPATDVFVPFAPEQIKSVDNIGTFSANSPRLLFQPAYHSSPHSFDKFELSPRTSKTGEGNHDFGYGHYFSTHDKAREFYRRTVAGPGGKEYKVDLPETNELLKWHHAFNEMSPEVQAKTNAALKTAGLGPAGSKMTGEQVYNLLAKKLGSQEAASAALRDAGVPGHQYLSGQLSGVPRDKAASNFVMYDPSRIKIEGKSTVDGLGQGDARGAIEFGDDGSSIIHMLKNADASTGLHELGHHFLKMYKSMADHPNAPAALRGDWATVKDWWKKNAVSVAHDSANKDVQPAHVRAVLENGTTGNATLDEAVNRGFHEQWARAFERYLRDGIAPSSKLQAVFDKFKGWLTKVYHSLAGLNVDLSPEMKGVFDRMLATPETPIPAPKMMDAAAAGRFKAASAATKNIKETFGAKPVNKMMQRPGASYPYTMPNEAVAGALWKAGPEGASTIKSVLGAAGDAKEARSAIEAAAVLSLKRAAAKDGVIDPAKLSAWRAKHADALAEVPGLEKRLSDAGKAAEAMVRIGESRRKVIAQVQKTAVGKLLNLSSDTDVAATVGSMLGRKDAVKAMAELMRTASNDPAATDGLRRAVVDHMLGRLKSSKDVLRSDTFQRFLGKNTPALAKVLTPQQMNGLRAIAQDLKRASKDYRAPGGGSDTAENLAAGNYYGTTKPTILGQIMHRVVQAATSSGVGYVLGVLTHPLAGIAGAIGSGAMAIARDAGMTKVNDLIKEAILNPDLMEALLKKAPKRANTGSHTGLAATLGKIALTAGVLSQQ